MRVPLRHTVNLLSGYLTHKRQIQLWRKALIAAAWLGVIVAGLSAWSLAQQTEERLQHYAQLRADHETLLRDRDRLTQRNTIVDHDAEVVADIVTRRGTSTPSRILSAVAATAPVAVDVTESIVRFDNASGRWQVRISGQIRSDEFSAPEILSNWISQLARTSPSLELPEPLRSLTPAGADLPTLQRFSMEGTSNER